MFEYTINGKEEVTDKINKETGSIDFKNGVPNCMKAVYLPYGHVKFGLMKNKVKDGVWIEK